MTVGTSYENIWQMEHESSLQYTFVPVRPRLRRRAGLGAHLRRAEPVARERQALRLRGVVGHHLRAADHHADQLARRRASRPGSATVARHRQRADLGSRSGSARACWSASTTSRSRASSWRARTRSRRRSATCRGRSPTRRRRSRPTPSARSRSARTSTSPARSLRVGARRTSRTTAAASATTTSSTARTAIYHADFDATIRLPALLTTLAQGRFVELPRAARLLRRRLQPRRLAVRPVRRRAARQRRAVPARRAQQRARLPRGRALRRPRLGPPGRGAHGGADATSWVGISARRSRASSSGTSARSTCATRSTTASTSMSRLQGVGIGTRASLARSPWGSLTGEAFLAVPTIETINTKREPHLFFQVRAEF